jgi:hypothetical protein
MDVHPLNKAVEDQANKIKTRTRAMHMLIELFENGRFGDLPKTSTKAERGRFKFLSDRYDPMNTQILLPTVTFLKGWPLCLQRENHRQRNFAWVNGLIGNSVINHPKMHRVREYILQLLDLMFYYVSKQPGKRSQILEQMICDMKAALGVSGRTRGGEGQADEESNFGWLDVVTDLDEDAKMSPQVSRRMLRAAFISHTIGSSIWLRFLGCLLA